jgi:hypothetical protein
MDQFESFMSSTSGCDSIVQPPVGNRLATSREQDNAIESSGVNDGHFGPYCHPRLFYEFEVPEWGRLGMERKLRCINPNPIEWL